MKEASLEPFPTVFYKDGRAATLTVEHILGKGQFAFPKDAEVIAELVGMASAPGDVILDSFAGSGTTGHAVLQLNAAGGKPRHFVLIQMPLESVEQRERAENIAKDRTAKRVRLVAEGYTNLKRQKVAGLGGGFRFCELGEPLFDEGGKIRESVRFADLARHVYFSETGEPLPRERVSAKSPLLGVHHGRAVCLLFNGILKDKTPGGGNALTQESLALLRAACDGAHGGPVERLVVYGTSQRLSAARLKREGVTFKQIPYSIRTA